MPRHSKKQTLFSGSPAILLCIAMAKGSASHKLLQMVVDTGASFTTIPVETATRLGLDPSRSKERVSIVTANGLIYAPLIEIPVFGALGIELRNFKVACHDLPAQSHVHGLLGRDFLLHFPPYQAFEKAILAIAPQFWKS